MTDATQAGLRAAHDIVPYPLTGRFAEVRMLYCRRCGATQLAETPERAPMPPCPAAARRDPEPTVGLAWTDDDFERAIQAAYDHHDDHRKRHPGHAGECQDDWPSAWRLAPLVRAALAAPVASGEAPDWCDLTPGCLLSKHEWGKPPCIMEGPNGERRPTIEAAIRSERGPALDVERLARAWFDGFRAGLDDEPSNWNATDETLWEWAAEYAAQPASEPPDER